MRGHPPPELVAAGHDVEHAGRQHLVEDLADQQRAARRVRRRLQHHGVAGEQRRADLPAGQHDREVPRGDRGDDADRAAHHLGEGGVVVLDHLARHLEVGEVAEPVAHGHAAPSPRRRAACPAPRSAPGRRAPPAAISAFAAALQRGPSGVLVAPPVDERLRRRVEGLVELLAAAVGGLGVDLAGGGVHPRRRSTGAARRSPPMVIETSVMSGSLLLSGRWSDGGLGDHVEERGAGVGDAGLLEDVHRVRHEDHRVEQLQEPLGVLGQVVEVEAVEVGDGLLGPGGDGVVELPQLVEGLRQARGVALGPGGPGPVLDPRLELGEAVGERRAIDSPRWPPGGRRRCRG